MDITTQDWIAEQAAAGRRLADLWDTIATRAWITNVADARAHLSALSLTDLIAFDHDRTGTPDNEVLAAWAGRDPGATAQLPTLINKPAKTASKSEALALLGKLYTIADARGIPAVTLVTEALTGLGAASLIAKNPSKQNPYEHAAARYIATAGRPAGVVAAIRLGEIGIDLRFLPDGDWVTGRRRRTATKSADLVIVQHELGWHAGRIFVCAHKYARVVGGHQDNQLDDALAFARCGHAARLHGTMPAPLAEIAADYGDERMSWDWRCGLILDGQYFASRIPRLCRWQQDPEEHIGSTDDWVSWLSRQESDI